MTAFLDLIADTPLSVKLAAVGSIGLASFGFGLALGAVLIRAGMAVRQTVNREPSAPTAARATRIDRPDDWLPAPMYLPRDDHRP